MVLDPIMAEINLKISATMRRRHARQPYLWRKHNLPLGEVKHMYLKDRLSYDTIGKKFGCSGATIRKRLQARGIPAQPYATGESCPQWKGGRRRQTQGYIEVFNPQHPRANANGYVLEQVKVWEEEHGTPIPEGWVIHHINGVRDDNHPHNLEALPRGKHMSNHMIEYHRKRRLI